ncbi:MAG: 1-acyl-sn-glycerol-3-phosphate acyltransferase [Bacteroidales bacterium]|nr:1-acyl-sn-glycerol-3-phosphate acyltransferase [Bacteroidales bacterium]
MNLFFTIIYDFFTRRRLVFFLFLGLTLTVIIWFALRLKIAEDISKVLPHNEKVDQYLEVVNQSAFADELVIFIGPADTAVNIPPEDLISFAGELADSVRSALMPGLVSNLRERVDDASVQGIYKEFHQHLPIFLDDHDYLLLDSLTTTPSIDHAVRSAYKNLVSPAGMVTRDILLNDPLGFTGIALKKLESFKLDESYRTLDGYIFSGDLKYLVMFLTPAQKSTETNKNGVLLKKLGSIFQIINQHNHEKIKAGYFGTLAVSVANAGQLKRDIILTMSLAVVLLILFIGFYFGHFRVIPAIVVTTLMSAGISVAALSLMNREISAISLGFGAVLLGIAIAYTIHYLNHLREMKEPRNVLKEIALPIVMSSIISSGDFFTLLLVRSEAVRDLGLFAGFSILAAGLLTLIFLPHLTKKIKWERTSENLVNRSILKLAAYPIEKHRLVTIIILLLTVVFFFTSRRVSFESDLTGMSYMPQEIQNAEATLEKISQYTLRSVFVVTRGENLDEALSHTSKFLERVKQLKDRGLVKKFASVTSLAVPANVQQTRITRWNDYWTPEKKAMLRERLTQAAVQNGFKVSGFEGFFYWLDKDFIPAGPDELPGLTRLFLDPYISEGQQMATVTTVLKVRQEDKPLIYEALKGEEASFIFDKQFLTSTFMDILNEDFNKLVIVSLLIVFFVLLISYGRIELALITFIPMFISWIWTLGIMGLFGMKLNIFNLIITSFVFGLGVDYAIFSIQGMLQKYKYGHADTNSYRTSVLMDATTTLIGLGVLVLAVHPALRTMAYAAIIGIVSVWFVTWSLEPILFKWLVYLEESKRPVPVTLKDFLFAILSLTIFVTTSILIMIFGLVFFKIFRLKNKQIKDWFHYGLMISSRFLIYANFLSPKQIIKPEGEDFKKPAMLIANHQSHIDIALILMLHPRLLVLTNDRVQQSRLYGSLVKMAEFFAISDGMESLTGKLRKNVAEGYSILIFPEGTRSPDTHLQRFHKGAFYLAQELGIDILPVIIHGSGPVMTKGEYFLKAGSAIIKFLPRIRPDDKRFGESLLERSRAIRHYMSAEYHKVAETAENPAYFREKLIKNYLYKGPILEWYLKVKIRLEKNYEMFHLHLPKEGHITDIGCGYGFMDYMLSFLSEGRRITGIDYDREKIEVANNCPAKNERLRFICGDALEMAIPKSRAFILADVLHYFPEEEQEKLIIRCIENLDGNGILIIRDADCQMGRKHAGTRLSEFFSTRIDFNQTHEDRNKLYFTSRAKISEILSRYDLDVEVIDETKMTSNIVFIGRKK